MVAETLNHIDTLTELPNRVYGCQLVEELILTDKVTSAHVIVLEISRFGQISDSVGNSLADKILTMTAKRLSKIFSDAMCIYRSHGDNFCLVFDGDLELQQYIEKLQDFIQRPFAVRGKIIVLSVRIGLVTAKLAEQSYTNAMHCAEAALHYAKMNGLKVCLFETHMLDTAKKEHQVANDLRRSLISNSHELFNAIASDEFYIAYQPIISRNQQNVAGLEALLRWNHSELGTVMPSNFIHVAEDIGVMDVLGAWVLRKACADTVQWQQTLNLPNLSISINVSPKQLINADILLNSLEQAIESSSITPHLIRIEITESVEFADSVPASLQKIRSLGCKVALDDFGPGYSSIVKLTTLPISDLKVDRFFILDLYSADQEKSDKARIIARGIYGVANGLGLNVITEGVETASQLAIVTELGADLIQGYYFSKPLLEKEITDFLQHSKVAI